MAKAANLVSVNSRADEIRTGLENHRKIGADLDKFNDTFAFFIIASTLQLFVNFVVLLYGFVKSGFADVYTVFLFCGNR